jgi:hypothetical protein
MNTTQVHFHPCTVDNQDFSNFAYQVKMTFIQGDCGGMLFRAQRDMFYYFYICQDDDPAQSCSSNQYSYGLIRYIKDNASLPFLKLEAGCSQYINAGSNQTNTIAVRAQGPTIGLYVNQHSIWSQQDSSYLHGSIGVLARTFDPGRSSQVAFSDATVWKL